MADQTAHGQGALAIDAALVADICQANDIEFLGLFGSSARGEARPNSDLDILIRFARRDKTFLDLAEIEEALEERLGRTVDLVTEAALSPYIRDRVLRDLRTVCEREG